jgi:nucleotide-binding universal stress UspA family protein
MQDPGFPDAILVAVDFSPASRRAVELAFSWTGTETEITLLHVIDTSLAESVESAGIASRAEAIHRMSEQAEKELAILVTEERKTRMEAMIVEGLPFVEIVRIANDLACGLIIMGSHSQASLEGVLFGSTAEKVVRSSRQPVLCVP